MPYTKKTWVNGPAGGTPVNALSLNHLETQYDQAVDYVDGLAGIEYTQASPLATWTVPVPTDFARRPNVTVYVAGEEVDADVTASTTAVTITFASPQSGTAVLS